MIRHSFFSTLLIALTGLFNGQTARAQGQDSQHRWNGNPVSSVADNTNEDNGTVYLYNVGTGEYLNTGSYWGTVVIGFNVGMPIHIQKTSSSGVYRMTGPLVTTEGKNIAFGRKQDTPGPDSIINYNRVYVDRGVAWPGSNTGVNGILNWTFSETYLNSKTYYIHCYNDENTAGMEGEIYLTMNTTPIGKTYDISYPHYFAGKYSQWKLVTKADLKAAFKEQYASDEDPADATFLVYDQQFERGNTYVDHWVPTGVVGTHDAQYLYNPSNTGETYYVGNGSIKSDYYMAHYAGYTTANVRNIGYNSKANGSVIQTVTTLKAGWYKVSCNGFYHPAAGSGLKSKLVAKVQGTTNSLSNVETTLQRLAAADQFSYTKADMTHVYGKDDLEPLKESPYVKAGKLFTQEKYVNTLMVYVPNNGDKLDIGIRISGSTKDLDWTSWDNFQLQYCGNRDLVLDEAQTSLGYMTQQVDPATANTLILKRSLNIDKWNSIMLPVELTAGQVKTAFGEQCKLSQLPHQSATNFKRIDFTKVDLSNDNAVAIKPNTLYIIRPTKEPTGTQGNSYQKLLKDGTTITVLTPFYIINNVTLATDPTTAHPNGIVKEASTQSSTTDGHLKFCGSLIKQTSPMVPAYSYALGAKDGLWHYTHSDLTTLGFRCWIATGTEALARSLKFYIDGQEEGNVTAIVSPDMPGTASPATLLPADVYTLSGQLVRRHADTLDGLPRGVYIVNRQKIIIR